VCPVNAVSLGSAVATILLYGDTVRYPSMRHEVPLEIIDPFLFVARDENTFVLSNSLEAERIKNALPEAELLVADELGLFELLHDGVQRDEAELTVAIRALRRWGIEQAVVPSDLPVAIADGIRAAGVEIEVNGPAVERRRRIKSPAELSGIRRAQDAAEAGMAAAEQLIREAEPDGEHLRQAGEPLTAERVRAAIRSVCAAAGCPTPPDIMVVSALSGGGHDPGSGPLPADLPITVDVWPRDEVSGCWADMTRTFVAGRITEPVAELCAVVLESLEAARSAAGPGITGQALYELAAEVIERAGHPTQRTREPGQRLTHGFYFSLGHGVGLEVHEPPLLGLAGTDPLLAGDVIAIEPGVEGVDGIGGVRFEDLLLITDEGCETLTRYPYDL
jgi:Xaa-Pro aminopeptidase